MTRTGIRILVTGILFFVSSLVAYAQQKATIYGTVKDTAGEPIQLVFIGLYGEAGLPAVTDSLGRYFYDVPANKEIEVIFSHTGFVIQHMKLNLKEGEKREVDVSMRMSSGSRLDSVMIMGTHTSVTGIMELNPHLTNFIPTPSGDITSLIITQPGVFSRTELGSEYSVRGGSYDENLVYVNGIEVYRPFLIHQGEQEGLTFANPDMVSSLNFSNGGFEAKYGDKMSSVLDITYKKPRAFAATASASLLGGTAHIEGCSMGDRLTWIIGARYKSNQYLLKGLDIQGDYKPKFGDVQAFVTYALTDHWEIDILGNYAVNQYNFIPQSETTSFGTISQAYQLQVYFQGQEVDKFQTAMGAVSAIYNKNIYKNDFTQKLTLRFTASAFNSLENQDYDIIGQYMISELNANLGSSTFGQASFGIGVGAYVNHARDDLNATVANFQHSGVFDFRPDSKLMWGVTLQHEKFTAQVSQWSFIDSAGYSLPYSPYILNLQNVAKSWDTLESNRFMGYVEDQTHWRTRDTSIFTLTFGVRGNYSDMNSQLVISPRGALAFKPNWKKHDLLFRFSTGFYYQPPFYREILDKYGELLTGTKAQESIHFVLGADWTLKAWGKPFKWITEAYYKDLVSVEPYQINDVFVNYYPSQTAHGSVQGIDMKINGDFVKGLESWFSLSVMQAKYQINDAFYYNYYNSYGQQIIPGVTANTTIADSVKHPVGAMPMPTDERVTVGFFFEDYLPKNPNLKVNLNILFGTGIPFGPPSSNPYGDTLRMALYKRVDLGASYLIVGKRGKVKTGLARYFKSIWAGLEVFNLLQVNNVITYTWIQDVNGRKYAVPNYLTSREVNVKVIIDI